MPVITRDFILSGRSDAGGWNRVQIEELGIAWPPKTGWIERACGQEIADVQAERFLSARNHRQKLRPAPEFRRLCRDFLRVARERLPADTFAAIFAEAEAASTSEGT